MMKKTFISCQTFFLLGVLSVSAKSDNLIICAVDRDLSPFIPLLKEKYSIYANLLPCNYWISPEKYVEGHVSTVKNNQNGEAKENASETEAMMKDAREKKSEEIGFHRAGRVFDDRLSAMFARMNPTLQDYKRGPGFRSWGGKRTWVTVERNDAVEKRPRFSSWGGKRSHQSFTKGEKASSEGGCEGEDDTCDDNVKRDSNNNDFYEGLLTRDPFPGNYFRNNGRNRVKLVRS